MTTPPPALAAGTLTLGSRSFARMGYGLGSLTRSAGTSDGFAAGVSLLHHAVDQGITFFDTAQFYGAGLANELLGSAFAKRRDEVIYATKVGARPVTDGPVPMTAAQKPGELRAAVEENLNTLGTDHLDLVYLRRMDTAPGLVIPADDDQSVPLDDQLAELIAMRDEGLLTHIGLSHVSGEQLQQALPARIAAVSNIFNYLHQDDAPLLATCEEHDIIWAPYFPLGGGGYANLPRVVDDPRVQREAEHRQATPSQVGLAWLLGRSRESLVIAGTSQIAHLDENIGAAAITVTLP